MPYYLAIDIGASSGRHIVGWREDGRLRTKEVYRFENQILEKDGQLVWDMETLFQAVKEGIKRAFQQFPEIRSLSVDTWGVDYVLLREGRPLLPVYAYRDRRTEKVVKKVHKIIPFSELYRRTGCQFQSFNSIYQLYDDLQSGRLARADALLMIPEYLLYRLCGVQSREYTNATTTGMVNCRTGQYDNEILEQLGYPKRLFPMLSAPGTVLGELTEEIQAEVGGCCKVVLCATHDTASAVEGIPMEENAPYISSGTWSLLGVKTPRPLTDAASEQANYSNEGGVSYNRYQKNIMGLWLINELRRELCPGTPFSEIVSMARGSICDVTVDANSPLLLSPRSMKAAFDCLSEHRLKSNGDYFRCAYRSLAANYGKAVAELEHNTGVHYQKLYIVGGGAKNPFLNRLTEEATGMQILALPIEATALGNLKIQMES